MTLLTYYKGLGMLKRYIRTSCAGWEGLRTPKLVAKLMAWIPKSPISKENSMN
jgi:hypothetical protein